MKLPRDPFDRAVAKALVVLGSLALLSTIATCVSAYYLLRSLP